MKELSVWEATYRSGYTSGVTVRFAADSAKDAVEKAEQLAESGGPHRAFRKPVVSVSATDEKVWVL